MLIQVFIVLIPVTIALIILVAVVFHRALHNGQFENLDTVSEQLLADDDRNVQITMLGQDAHEEALQRKD